MIDVETKQPREYSAKLVFLCASTLGSTRLLLNSKSASFPNGLANSSGVLGQNLMDHHFMVGGNGQLPDLADHYSQGNRPNGIYIPRFRNLGDERTKRSDYIRGFGYQGGASRGGWGRGIGQEGIGVQLKSKLREPGDWGFGINGFAECLPRKENFVELSSETDGFGIPTLRVSCDWGPNELAMRKDVMHYERLDKDELFEALREQGIDDLAKVRVGILEPDGKYSFFTEEDHEPAPESQAAS